MGRISRAIKHRQAVDRLRAALMAAKGSRPGSNWKILKKRNSALIVARDEGCVTRVYRLYVGIPLGIFVGEPDSAGAKITEVAEEAHDIPEVRGAVAYCEWPLQCAQRALEKARER
jgi:hypothetical protein